jgi:hypothetical protein
LPAVGARRHALVAGVRLRPGDDQPVPVLLALASYLLHSRSSSLISTSHFFFSFSPFK